MVEQVAQAAQITRPRNLREALQALRLAHALAAMEIHRLRFVAALVVAVALRTDQMPVQMAALAYMAAAAAVGLLL